MSDAPRDRKPVLRPVEAFPLEHEGEKMLCLRDPLAVADGPILFALHPATLLMLQHFDGEHSLGDLQLLLSRRFGELVPTDQIAQFVEELDQHGYIEGPAFQERLARRQREYLDLPERPATILLGDADEAAEELRRQWHRDENHPLGPGAATPAIAPGSVAAILAPHIDYLRGGYAYAWAYRALAQGAANARVFVILGTIHRPMSIPFAATRKPFGGPFGPVRVEETFLDALRERFPEPDLLGDEFAHANEHSIELQVLYLQHILRDRKDDWRIVPILVDSFEEDVQARRSPMERDDVKRFVGALRDTIASWGEEVCVIGGVDFAHVGPRFGAENPVGDEELGAVARQDRAMLDAIEAVAPEEFMRGFFADGNARHVCSIAPIYCLLHLLDGTARGATLRYGQAVDPDRGGAVSFGGVVFTRTPKDNP